MRKWRIIHLAMIVILLVGLIGVPLPLYAATPDFLLEDQTLEFTIDSNTALGGDGETYYSRNSTLTPNKIDLSSLGVDTSKVQSATLTSSLGTADCSSKTECVFSEVSGTAVPVNAFTSQDTYFDWWRNQAGNYHGYWWSFDLEPGVDCTYQFGVTCYSEAGGEGVKYNNGNHSSPVPARDFPGDYSYPTTGWEYNGSLFAYDADDGSFTSLSYNYVSLERADIALPTPNFVLTYPTTVTPDSNGVVSFNADLGPFDGTKSGYTLLGSDPLGYRFPSGFEITFVGNTYTYNGKWKLEVYYTGSSGVSVSNPGCMDLSSNKSKTLTATLTNSDGTTQDVTSSTNTSWSSSNSSVATVSSGGVVTAVGIGTTTIEAHYVDSTAGIDDTGSTSIEVKTSCSGTPPTGDPKCLPTIQPPTKGTINSGTSMDPRSHAVLKADNRGGEFFDVALGIPTSESLYANAFGLNYLFQNKFANMTGEVSFAVEVTKKYVWSIPGGPEAPPIPMEQTVTQTMTVKRPYSYWQIDNLEVYKLGKSTISNYALGGYPSSTIQLDPAGYTAPTLQSDNKDDVKTHVHPPACSGVNLGVGGGPPPGGTPPEFQGAAEGAVGRNQVNNDKVVFNGQTIMENAQHPDQGTTPGTIPQPVEIGQNVLFKSGLVVSKTLINKADQSTSGKIYYPLIPGNIKGGGDKVFDINGINTVTVHTPVVIYANISDDKEHNQKTIPAPNRQATILDRPFTIYMPTYGQHRNILGYGNRDYAKYVRDKQVWFPFDVYSGDKGTFYPKNTWISIPVNQEATTFFLPVWVDEGYYDVLFRTIAENAPSNFTTESEANLNLANHVATDVVPVDVIGRVYDLHITDIADFNWETFFRSAKGSSTPTGNSFWVGDQDIDGSARPVANNYILPVRQGSNPLPGMQNIAVKTGYKFSYDFKTKGNMFNDLDGVRLTPTFYFVQKDGNNRRLVDLYYHSDSERFIKVGSSSDVERRNVVLNSRLRNVPGQDIVDTSSTLWEMFAAPRGWSIDKQRYMDSYIKDTAKQTYVGGYDVQILTAPLRTFKGNMFGLPNGVNIYRANAAVQQWYGEYSLPASVYVVPQGTNLAQYGDRLDDKSSVFLRDGYIIVNFTIETIRDGDTSNPYLQYIRRPGTPYYGPYDNQWKDMEGFQSSFTTPYGVNFNSVDGDVIYYHADKSSYEDFTSSGTH